MTDRRRVPSGQVKARTGGGVPVALDASDWRFQRGCGNKGLRFDSMTDARKDAKRLRTKVGRKLWPYRCVYCAGVHLSSKPTEEGRHAPS